MKPAWDTMYRPVLWPNPMCKNKFLPFFPPILSDKQFTRQLPVWFKHFERLFQILMKTYKSLSLSKQSLQALTHNPLTFCAFHHDIKASHWEVKLHFRQKILEVFMLLYINKVCLGFMVSWGYFLCLDLNHPSKADHLSVTLGHFIIQDSVEASSIWISKP